MKSLQDFKDAVETEVHGETKDGHCVSCKAPFSDQNVHSEAGWRETKISKTCEDCFDRICAEPEEEMEEDDGRI